MNDEDKIKILLYWVEHPNKTRQIPKKLSGKISEKDINELLREVAYCTHPENGNHSLNGHDYLEHADRIRRGIKEELEIESIKLQNEIITKQTTLQEKLNTKQDETHVIMDKQNHILRAQVFITFILIIVTLFIGYQSNEIAKTQTNISELQTEILKVSSPSYEPKLRVWSKYEPIRLSFEELLKVRGERGRTRICIKNIGQTNTGHISAHWQNNWTHNSNRMDIYPGIEPGETNCTWLNLTAYDCWDDPDGCTEEIIPRGWIDLNLSITCEYCIQKESIKVFRACVFNESSRLDCK